jgi:hypothetical protein
VTHLARLRVPSGVAIEVADDDRAPLLAATAPLHNEHRDQHEDNR